MAIGLTNKTSKVIVVDPSGPVRQMMADTLRTALGYEVVEGKASVQDALQHLEVDHADWIITSLMPDQPVNAIHLLKVCTSHPELKTVRISLCLEDDEHYVLASAFEMGLLSYHQKPFTKDTLTSELKTLLAHLERNHGSEPLTATEYLAAHLKGAKNYAALMGLVRQLLELYPGHGSLLLELAEAQFHTKQVATARKTLAQVKMLDPKLGEHVEKLTKQLLGSDGVPDQMPDTASGEINVLGADNVVLVDSDELAGTEVEGIIKSLGAPAIHRFRDGEAAWAHIESNEPSLIVMEWRIPKLSGPVLIQRLRQVASSTVPVIILSSLLKPDDMPFLREIGVSAIVPKPLGRDAFVQTLIQTMQQERLPTDHQVLERRMRALIKMGEKAELTQLRAQYFTDNTVPLARRRIMEAEFAFSTSDYALARDAAVDALKLSGDSIFVLNVLGKAFMRLSCFDAALKCFTKAQEISPLNLERLCMIAETQAELGDPKAAATTLAEVTTIDPDSPALPPAQVSVAVTTGDTSAAKKLMATLESVEDIIAYMNNKAVALARCGKSSEAISLYKKTLESVPDDKPDVQATVTYNLALAQTRDGEYEAAISRLASLEKIKSDKVSKKALSLKERLQKAQTSGGAFKLRATDGEAVKDGSGPAKTGEASAKLLTEDDYRALLATVEAKRGDICCFLLFHNPDPSDLRVGALLAKPPRFQRRDAIERDETRGADKLIKAG